MEIIIEIDSSARGQGVHQEVCQLFKGVYGAEPEVVVAAPGRVNLLGDDGDLCRGLVLPMAINQRTYLAARRTKSSEVRVYSEATDDRISFSPDEITSRVKPEWLNYISGVFAVLRAHGLVSGGLDLVVWSTVPLNSGLGSSMALAVATATLLEAVAGRNLPLARKALLVRRAEREFTAAAHSHILDAFASVMGRAHYMMLLDCSTHEVRYVPFPPGRFTVLIVDTRVRRDAAAINSAWSERVAASDRVKEVLGCESLRTLELHVLLEAQKQLDATDFRWARHVLREQARVLPFAEAIETADYYHAGELLYESHESLSEDLGVSCRELDVVVRCARELGLENGVLGSRLIGRGFGGCAVVLVENAAVESVLSQISSRYYEETHQACEIFVSQPARGAELLKLVR